VKKRETTDYICIHCSATPPEVNWGVDEIRKLHVNDNGWSDIGYQWVIKRDGTIQTGRDEWRQGAHEPKINKSSVGICMVGGVASHKVHGKWMPENNFTKKQWISLKSLVIQLEEKYPGAKVVGHNQFSNKACPSFIVAEWYKRAIKKEPHIDRHVHINEPISYGKREDIAWYASPANYIIGTWRNFMASAVQQADEAFVPRVGRPRRDK
jgi:hypothetical protein